jgi:hypothetical protein
LVAVDVDEAAVGDHELDRAHVVGRWAVLAAQQALSAAERVADDTDVRGGAGQWSEPAFCCRTDQLA